MSAKTDPYSLLVEILNSDQVTAYFEVSAVALYVWDYSLNFDLELDLVWKSEWTLTKGLFLVQRYLPAIEILGLILYANLGEEMTIVQCQQVFQVLGWMMMSGILLSELLLALRVWAVWNREKWVTFVLIFFVIILWSPAFFYTQRFFKSVRFARPYPTYVGCFIAEASDVLFIIFVLGMIWDIGTLIFMLVAGFRAYQARGNSALFYVVYRDGITYYLYLVVLSFLNVIATKRFHASKLAACRPIRPLIFRFYEKQAEAQFLFLLIQRYLYAVLASRVILHIRRQVKYETEVVSQETNRLEIDMNASIRFGNPDPTSSV